MVLRSRRAPRWRHVPTPRAVALAASVGLGVPLLQGCGDGSPAGAPPGTGPTVRDSAGITVVDNPSPAWGETDGWRVEAEAASVLTGHGDPDFALFQVADLALLPDDAMAVANRGSGEIAVLEPDGRFRARYGRSGEGPGEFQWLNGVLTRGDSIVAVDGARLRLSVFAPDGSLAREFAVDPEPGQPTGIRVVGMGDDGVAVFREIGFAEKLDPGILRLPGTAFRLDWAGGRAAGFPGDFPGGAIFILSDGMGTLPMGPDLAMAAAEGRFVVGTGARAVVREYASDGRLVRSIRWAHDPAPVDEGVRNAWIASQLEGLRESLADQPEEVRRQAVEERRRVQERIPFPEAVPALTDLVLDATGHLWVHQYRTGLPGQAPTSWMGKEVKSDAPLHDRPGRWWIFDPDGRWLGEVATPPGLRVEVVTDDAVWGVHRDELGVETIRRHALVRAGAPGSP